MMKRAEVKSNDALSFRSSARQDGRSILDNRANRRHVRFKETRLTGNWAVSNLFQNLSVCRKFIRRTKWIFSQTASSLVDLCETKTRRDPFSTKEPRSHAPFHVKKL